MKFINITKTVTIIFTMLFVFSSCSDDETNKEKEGKAGNSNWKSNVIGSIDGTIAFVGSIDFMKIIDKSSVMDAEIIPEMYKSMIMGYMDSDNLGIQLEGNNHFALVLDNSGEFDYAFAFANVLDADKIADNLHTYLGGRTDKEGGYSFLKTSEGVVFGWDNKHLIVAVSEDGRSNVNELKNTIIELLDSREKDVEINDQLLAYMNRKDDMNMYMNMENYMDFIQKLNKKNNTGNNIDFSDEDLLSFMNYNIVMSTNFNNGSIVLNTDINSNSGNAFKFLNEEPVGKEYLNFLTDNNKLLACGFANIDVENYTSLVMSFLNSNNETYNEFNSFLVEMGISENEIFNVFNGEIAFSLIDLEAPEKSISEDFGEWNDDFFDKEFESSSNEPTPTILLTLGINDQSSLMKLMASAPVNIIEGQVIEIDESHHFLLLKDNKLHIGSHKELLDKLNELGSLKAYNKIKIDHPVYFYVNTDADSCPEGFSSTIEAEGGSEMFNSIMSLLSSIEVKGNNNQVSYEIQMSNSKVNSLKVIFDFVIEQLNNNPELMYM